MFYDCVCNFGNVLGVDGYKLMIYVIVEYFLLKCIELYVEVDCNGMMGVYMCDLVMIVVLNLWCGVSVMIGMLIGLMM